MRLSVREDISKLESVIDALADKQIRFAISRALNDTASAARDAVRKEMPSIFDRPTPYTENSVAMLASSRERLVSTVLIKDRQAQYLAIEETGGVRTAGSASAPGIAALTLPGVAAQLNEFGNLPNHYQRNLRRAAQADAEKRSDVRAGVATTAKDKRRLARQRAAISRDKGIFYSAQTGPHGHGPGGYFVRTGDHELRRLTGFEQTETYKPRFGFGDRVRAAAAVAFPKAFVTRLREAIATAR